MLEKHVIDDLLDRDKDESAPLVVMMCGIAGAGKTTFAQQLEKEGFARVSIDEEIWATHGRYGIDFPLDKMKEFKRDAEQRLQLRLIELIQENRRVVIDYSFWDRLRRDRYKQLIKENGGKWKLIYLKVSADELRRRLKIRNERFDANAFPITDELLASYLEGFEEPVGEGETVIE